MPTKDVTRTIIENEMLCWAHELERISRDIDRMRSNGVRRNTKEFVNTLARHCDAVSRLSQMHTVHDLLYLRKKKN